MVRLDSRTRRILSVSLVAAGLATALPGVSSAAPPVGSVLSATDLGPVAWDARIVARDGGYSARWGSSSVWVFGDTILTVPGADGSHWRDNSSVATTDLDGTDGISLTAPSGREHTDGIGVPTEYLPFSDWENWFNYANDPVRCGTSGVGDCGKQYFLWPGPVVPDPARNRVLYFFTSGMRGGSIDGYTNWGSGIAVWDAATGRTIRPETGPPPHGASWDRWTMFGPDTAERLYDGDLVVGGYLYTTGCHHTGFFQLDCRLARVPLADALTRAAWRFYTAAGHWSANPDDATTVFVGEGQRVMFYNTYLRRYVLIDGLNTAHYRTAPQPWGPWSDRADLFQGVAPAQGYNYFVLAHPEYGAGRTIYVTYYRPKAGFAGEVRLTKVVFN